MWQKSSLANTNDDGGVLHCSEARITDWPYEVVAQVSSLVAFTWH